MENKDNTIQQLPKEYKFNYPAAELLKKYTTDDNRFEKVKKMVAEQEKIILQILNNPDIGAIITDVQIGTLYTRFTISIATSILYRKAIAKIDDLNLWLGAKYPIRIVGGFDNTEFYLEVAHSGLANVGLIDLLTSEEYLNRDQDLLTVAPGSDVAGKPIIYDLARFPNLLVGGACGVGKSVFLRALLLGLIYKYSPEELRFVYANSKMEAAKEFNGLPNMLFNKVFSDVFETEAMLENIMEQIECRYRAFREAGVCDIKQYNEYVQHSGKSKLPKILIVIDEYAEIYYGREKSFTDLLLKLTTKGRAAGVYFVIATQRPSTLNGAVLNNINARLAFRTANVGDSYSCIKMGDATKLCGYGDMLFLNDYDLIRGQSAFVSLEECAAVFEYVKNNNDSHFDEDSLKNILRRAEELRTQSKLTESETEESETEESDLFQIERVNNPSLESERKATVITKTKPEKRIQTWSSPVDEETLKQVMRMAIKSKVISISKIQRSLSVGYPRAGRIFEVVIEKGYVSQADKDGKHKILMTGKTFKEIFGEEL